MAKKLSLIAICIIALLGIVLVFIPSIDMNRFKVLCESLAPFIVTLLVSIGGNSAIQKFLNNKDEDK